MKNKSICAILFCLALSPLHAQEKARDYLDCTIKRKVNFKEEKKKKFYINFILKRPIANDIDLEKVNFKMDKKWIKTNLTLNHEGHLSWTIEEEGFPLPHPSILTKIKNYNSKTPFPIKQELKREIGSTKSITYILTCK